MELRIAKDELARAVGSAQGIVPRKSTMPILSNILVDARPGGELVLSATDLDVSMRIDSRADVSKPGAVTVGAKHFYDIVKNLPGPDITLRRLDNHYVEVVSGRVQFRIVGMAADEFPRIPEAKADKMLSMPPALLKELVDKTLYSVSTDETRYVLNGVYVEPQPEGLAFISTDGHRLSMCTRKVAGVADAFSRPVILPRKGLAELRRILDDGETEVQVGLQDNHAVVRRGGASLVMRLIEGRFPDYRQVVPQGAERIVKMAWSVVVESLKRISLVSADRSSAVRLELTKDLLRISSQNPDLGEASEEIPVDYQGGDLKIGFNARYLIEAISALAPAENVSLEFNDELSPGLVRRAEDANYICVVMPMRI